MGVGEAWEVFLRVGMPESEACGMCDRCTLRASLSKEECRWEYQCWEFEVHALSIAPN